MTKVARIHAEDGASARVADPHIGLDPPVWRSNAQYYAFLSYSHKDEDLADWLHHELERFQVPRALAGKLTANGVIPKRLTPVFRDRHELAAAKDLGEEIEAALAASQYLLVLCSPDAAKSHWTNAEIETFKRTRPDGCVLAAIVAGDPFASDIKGHEGEECFPPALRQKFDRRGRATGKRAEPLAADLRDTGDGRRMGFLKLVAGMLGVGLDELVQRDTMRRQRRLAWLSAASLAGMVITSSLALFALQARDEARDQRREAESLVSFMLGDLKDKLEPIGRLDALDGVGRRVLSYYSKQDAADLSDASLLQRARALSLTAEVAYLRGDLDTAQRLYLQAMSGTAEAVHRSPDDPKRLFDHAQNVFWMGELARLRGRSGPAEAAFREYKRLADLMVSIEPDNLKWRMETQYAAINLGIVLYNQRRFAEAARHFQGALRPMESLAAIDSGNTEYQKELSNLLAWLADTKQSEGQLDQAIAIRERQLAFLHRLAASGTADVELGEKLIPAHTGLAILLATRGQAERGIEQLRLAVAEADRLIPIEPANTAWKVRAAQARLELGKTLLSLGRNEEAAKEIRIGCDLTTGLRARGPNVAKSLTLETACLAMRSRLALASGANAEASVLAERALASARTERSGDPIADRYSVAAAYRLLGDVRQRAGDREAARAAWDAGLSKLPQGVVERPRELVVRTELLKRLGRIEEARVLTEKLDSIGYQSVG